MRRFALLLAILLSAVTLDAQVRLRFVVAAVQGSAPGSPANFFPSCGATGVGLSPTLTFTSTGALTYSTKFGTVTPPVTVYALGGNASYAPGTLAQLTTYYWRPSGINTFGITEASAVCSFTTTGPSTFLSHPRLLLTSSMLTRLAARVVAVTTEYTGFKNWVDGALPSTNDNTTLSGSLNATGKRTTQIQPHGVLGLAAGIAIGLSPGHAYTNGQSVVITGTTNHNGTVTVTRYDDNYFYFTSAFDATYENGYSQLSGEANPTFTVTDGSSFPTASAQYRVGLELITATRSANTLTIVSRGDIAVGVTPGTPQTHSSGETIWEHEANGNWVNAGVAAALLVQLGISGYDVKARNMFNYHMVAFEPLPLMRHSQNYIRWSGFYNALAYDWLYSNLTASEKTIYSAMLFECADWHSTQGNLYGYVPSVQPRVRQTQTALAGNVSSGQLRSAMAMAAAVADEQAGSQAVWDRAYGYYTTYVIEALKTGSMSGGNGTEGSQYAPHSFFHMMDMAWMVQSAVGANVWADLDPWVTNLSKWLIYSTSPGSSSSTTSTTGSVSAASTTFTAAAAGDFASGNEVAVSLNSGASLKTTLCAVSGTTFTLCDPAPTAATAQPITHRQTFFPYGDVEGDVNFEETTQHGNAILAAFSAIERMKTSDATTKGYLQYWLAHYGNLNDLASYEYWQKFLWYDPTVTAVDYTAILPKCFASAGADSTGIIGCKSAWTPTSTRSWFFVGNENWDHTQTEWNTIAIYRNGVKLTGQSVGYSADALTFHNIFTPPGTFIEDWPIGCRYQGCVLMNSHGGAQPYLWGTMYAAAQISRVKADSATYAYARGDASGPYRGDGAPAENTWTNKGYPNNNARTFVRDWFSLPTDLTVVFDRLTYSAAATSQTQWNWVYPGDPSLSSQRITMTYGGQKLIQDVVLPTSATITEVAHSTEDPYVKGYREEVVSGVSASEEIGLFVFQSMASGDTASTVTTLTTTNAKIVEIAAGARCANGCIVGGVLPGTSVTLNITYTYASANPDHYLTGFAPSTNYHVVESAGAVTISAATGSGDTTSSAEGLLVF